MSEKNKVSVEFVGSLELAEAKGVLRDLFESLEKGQVVVQKGHEHVVLTLGQVVDLKVSGRRKKGKQSLSLEISWRDEAVKAERRGFSISSTAPVGADVAEETPAAEASES
jgi:amphi-Trp domain-containing protein